MLETPIYQTIPDPGLAGYQFYQVETPVLRSKLTLAKSKPTYPKTRPIFDDLVIHKKGYF